MLWSIAEVHQSVPREEAGVAIHLRFCLSKLTQVILLSLHALKRVCLVNCQVDEDSESARKRYMYFDEGDDKVNPLERVPLFQEAQHSFTHQIRFMMSAEVQTWPCYTLLPPIQVMSCRTP